MVPMSCIIDKNWDLFLASCSSGFGGSDPPGCPHLSARPQGCYASGKRNLSFLSWFNPLSISRSGICPRVRNGCCLRFP